MIWAIVIFAYLFFVSRFIGKIKTEAGQDQMGGPVTSEVFNVCIAAMLPVLLVTLACDGFLSLFSEAPDAE